MDLSQQKEKFSDAYLQAVAAAAGYSLAKPNTDDDSIDWILQARNAENTSRRPRMEVQLKCSAQKIIKANILRFPLELKNYNDLRDAHVFTPRILIVVTVPEAVEEWLLQNEQEMILRCCAYWVSLHGMPETENKKTVTIELPRNNILTPDALKQMMQQINNGEKL